MSVEAVRLEHFMAFEDTGWLELGSICLLFGRNSTGKSAIIRALRLLKQSLGLCPEDGPFLFVREKGIDLDSFQTVVHCGKDSHPISFHFRCELQDKLPSYLAKRLARLQSTGEQSANASEADIIVDFRLSYLWNETSKKAELIAVEATWPERAAPGQERPPLFLAVRLSGQDAAASGGNWQFGGELLREVATAGEQSYWQEASIDLTSGFLPVLLNRRLGEIAQLKGLSPAWVSELLVALRESVGEFLGLAEYLGPVRPMPQRLYLLDRGTRQNWKEGGLQVFFRFLEDGLNESESAKIDFWAEKLNLAYKVPVQPLGPSPGESPIVSQVTVQENRKRRQRSINLADSGFGLAQVLPVVVHSLLAPEGALVIIEEPESHLHPRAQAELADLFVQEASRGVRFLLETHSENLLLRLRLRLAQTSGGTAPSPDMCLARGSLKAYFVDREPGRPISRVEVLDFDEWGDYVKRPPRFGDFFGQDFDDLVAMKRARKG